MIQELIKAFFLIFIAEMGDKTQILAMAFATRFPAKKVLMGIFVGCLLNHGLAVFLGSFVSSFIPINTVQIIAGFAFVGFSIWTLKSDSDDEEEDKQKSKFGPVITVAIAFFIGELGDKTQLTAITLAADAVYPLVILCGTVSGMIVTGGLGIIVGKKIGDKIPEFAIKIIAATVFMFIGITKLYQTLPAQYLKLQYISIFFVIIIALIYVFLRPTIKRRQKGEESLLIKKSRELYNYYHNIEANINNVCLGEKTCGNCKGDHCLIGYTKLLISNGLKGIESVELDPTKKDLNKKYDREKVIESLRITLAIIKNDPRNADYSNIHKIRKNLEIIIFGKFIDKMNNWQEYIGELKDIDRDISKKILSGIN